MKNGNCFKLVSQRLRKGILGITLFYILCIGITGAEIVKENIGDDAKKAQLRLLTSDNKGGSDGAISPDGKYFVVSSRRSGNLELWQFEIPAGKWTQLTNDPGDDFEAQWSPDGSLLVFTSTRAGNKDIWILSLKDGNLRQLTFGPEDDEYPTWSPKGNLIAYSGGAWGEREIFLIPAEGGESRQITNRSGRAGACSFAPNGESLICHSYEAGTGEVFKLGLDGQISWMTGSKSPWETDESIAWDYKPTYSPDGKWIAFSRSEDDSPNIWLIPTEGGNPEPLTEESLNDRWPTWAAGNRLFFHRIIDEGASLIVLDRKTNKLRTLVGEDSKPGAGSFDPEGKQVVYTAKENHKSTLRILNLQTGKSRSLSIEGKESAFPRWSPDGKKIACLIREDNRWEIATLNTDGTGLKIWTNKFKALKGMRGVLDWSPDSNRIVFKADTEPFESDLFILDTTNGKIINITNDNWFDESPSWTPDGKGIVFMSTRGGNWTWGLYTLSLEDGTVGLVARPDYTEKNFPRIDGSGRALWSAYGENGVEYLVEKVGNAKPKTLTAAGGWARWASSSSDGRFVLFTEIKHRVEYWLVEDLGERAEISDVCQSKPPDTETGGEFRETQSDILNKKEIIEKRTIKTKVSGVSRSPVNFPHR